MNATYRIVFTQRNTMATTFSTSVRKGGKVYYLKAESNSSVQHVGYAVVYPDIIEVTTVSGELVGIAKDRAEARRMIDTHHRTNNADAYWVWADKKLENSAGRPEVGKPINVRLGDDLLARLDDYADRTGRTRADALRFLVSVALDERN